MTRIVDATELSMQLKGWVHTLKGNCAQLGLSSVASLCHRIEEELEGVETPPRDGQEELSRAWTAVRKKLSILVGDIADLRLEIDACVSTRSC